MIKLRIFTLNFNKKIQGFDDTELKDFINSVDVETINSNFFKEDKKHYWSIAVHYSDLKIEEQRKSGKTIRVIEKEKESQKLGALSDRQKGLYNKLKFWRNEKAKTEGIPPYIIFNNRQLIEISGIKRLSLTKLKEIKGIGEKKAFKYFADIENIIKEEGDNA